MEKFKWYFHMGCKFCIFYLKNILLPFPPAEGQPVSPTIIGNDVAPILLSAALQSLSSSTKSEPALPSA